MTSDASPLTPHSSPFTHLVSIALLLAALVGVFYGLLQLDVPLARFLRSVHVARLDALNGVGNRLGSGIVLVAISGTLLALGLARRSPTLRQAGWHSLLAHAAAGLTVQVLKHLIGRPRPRLLHAGGFQFGPLWGPSLETGLDSFPSGHTAASVAVAVVLARHFPAAAPLFYAAAGFVATTRIIAGSHFPTDVLAGVTIGLLAGQLVSRPLAEWRRSLWRAVRTSALIGVVLLALFRVVMQGPVSEGWLETGLMGAGFIMVAAGVFSRLWNSLSPTPHACRLTPDDSHVLIGIGIGLTTGSVLVSMLAAMIGVAVRLVPSGTRAVRPLSLELLYAGGIVLTVVAIRGARGVLPL
jgi:membrane-associated phospholipid phosphatase